MVAQPLTVPQQPLPMGSFLLPICIDRQGVQNMLDAMLYARGLFSPDGSDLEYMYPLLESLAFVDSPGNAPCVAATPEEGDCVEYNTRSTIISFAPADPRIDPEFVPTGYEFPPFYFPPGSTDILTTLERVPNPLGAPELPRFRVTFTGAGQIEVHLLSVLQGGIAIVTLDDNPLSVIEANLEKDVTSVPPALTSEIIVEMKVEGAGAHHVDVTFLPRLDDSAIPLKYGGGLRSIVLCGMDIQQEIGVMQFRKKPLNPPDYTIDEYVLQVSLDGSTWFDTSYNLASMGKYKSTMVNIKDTTGAAIGTSHWDTEAHGGSDGVVTTLYDLILDRDALKGDTGDTGGMGHGIELLDPPLQAVLYPNQDPELVVDNALPTTTFVGFKNPRAPRVTILDTVTHAPGTPSGVAVSLDSHGDVVMQPYESVGLPGSAGSGIEIDEDPPEVGQFKDYDAIIPPEGYIVPVPLLENDVITVAEQATGLWSAKNEFASGDYVSDENGVVVGAVEDVGRLMHVIKRPASSVFGDEAFYSDPLVIDEDGTFVAFRQAKRTGFLPDAGYLKLRYTIYRPNLDFHIIGTHDFKPNDAGWHGVGADESNDVNWGGGWTAGTTPPTSGGFVPEYNATAGMFSLSFAPPLGAPLARIDDVTLFWEEAAGDFFWTVKTYYGGNWHYSIVPRLSGASGSDTIHVNTSCEKVIIHSNSYGVGTGFWRVTKVILTGAET